MSSTQNGLTNIGQGPGNTTNFAVFYEDSLPSQAAIKANADALLGVVENEFHGHDWVVQYSSGQVRDWQPPSG
jgi:hypothetical protein